MAGDSKSVSIAGVLEEKIVLTVQKLLGASHTLMEVFFIGFVRINAENHIPPTYELELGGVVVETDNLEHISHPIPIKTWAKF